MSAIKQAMAASAIFTALFVTQLAIASRITPSADGEQPVFHMGFVRGTYGTINRIAIADIIVAIRLHGTGEEIN